MERTIESVLFDLEEIVRTRQVISPTRWVEAGLYLNALIGEEYAKLASYESSVAKEELAHLSTSKSGVEAKMKTKASDQWLQKRQQELKVKQVEEYIKLAKKYGQLASDESRHGI